MSLVFLDRDGTINHDPGYLKDPGELKLIEGAARALGDLACAGFELVIVTNQSGIGRGYMTRGDVELVNERLLELLLAEDPRAKISQILICPHSPDEGCSCRKPATGLIDFVFAKDNSFLIGDKNSDIGLSENLGLPVANRLLVKTGEGGRVWRKWKEEGKKKALAFPSIVEASEYILENSK